MQAKLSAYSVLTGVFLFWMQFELTEEEEAELRRENLWPLE